MTIAYYQPLEVVETRSRISGRQFWVRDEEGAWFWCVEYIDRHLQCPCDDGVAHTESTDTEPECVHLRAVADLSAPSTQRPRAVVNAATFVD